MHAGNTIVFLVAFVLSIPLSGLPQPPAGQAKADSLAALVRAARTDTARARQLGQLARVWAQRLDRPDTAIVLAKQALKLAAGEPRYQSQAYRDLAACFRETETPDSALEYHIKAAAFAGQAGRHAEQARDLVAASETLEQTGDLAGSLALAKQAVAVAHAAGDSLLLAQSFLNEGTVYVYMGLHGQGLARFQKAVAIFHRYGEESGLAKAYNNLGVVHFNDKRYNKAQLYFTMAANLFKELNLPPNQAYMYINLGNIALERGSPDTALHYFRMALEICRPLNDPNLLASVYTSQALAFFDLKRYHDVVVAADSGIVYAERSQNIGTLAHAYGSKADAHLQMGKPSVALPFARKALALAFKSERPRRIYNEAELNARVDSTLGDLASALKHYRLHMQYRDSVYSQEKAEEIGRLEAQFAYEQEQQAVRRTLETEKAKLDRRNALQYTAATGLVLLLLVGVLLVSRMRTSRRWAHVLIFVSFILTYEFLLVLLDPFMDRNLPGPAWKLGLNALLAIGIAPLHIRLEQRVRNRLSRLRSVEQAAAPPTAAP